MRIHLSCWRKLLVTWWYLSWFIVPGMACCWCWVTNRCRWCRASRAMATELTLYGPYTSHSETQQHQPWHPANARGRRTVGHAYTGKRIFNMNRYDIDIAIEKKCNSFWHLKRMINSIFCSSHNRYWLSQCRAMCNRCTKFCVNTCWRRTKRIEEAACAGENGRLIFWLFVTDMLLNIHGIETLLLFLT